MPDKYAPGGITSALYPPPKIPLVGEEHPATPNFDCVKVPKEMALPVVAMVT